MPIIGTHVLLYTAEPEAVRTILRDVLELDHTAFLQLRRLPERPIQLQKRVLHHR